MESSADRDPYWTPAEVATWIQTRDVRQVEGIKDPTRLLAVTDESTPVLEDLPKRCRNGRVCVVGRRCNYYDSAFKRSEPIGGPLLWRSPRDGQPSDLAEKIPPHDWIDLTWEPPVNGKVTGNLYSKSRRRRAWEMVQFARSDVMREWPGPGLINDNEARGDVDAIAQAPSTRLRQAGERRGRRGPTAGEIDRYALSDRALFAEMNRLMHEFHKSANGAALELAAGGKIEGIGTPESRAKRLAKRFREERNKAAARGN